MVVPRLKVSLLNSLIPVTCAAAVVAPDSSYVNSVTTQLSSYVGAVIAATVTEVSPPEATSWVMFAGHEIVGFWVSVTIISKDTVSELTGAEWSATVHVTVVVPFSNTCPFNVVFGAVTTVVAPLTVYVIVGDGSQLSVGFNKLSPCV